MQSKRLDRVNQLIKEEVSTLLQRELKDPRLGFVTVTEVETSKDLRVAKVFVSVLGDEAQWAASLAALGSARGFVRQWLRHHLDLRVTPELDFRADRSMEHAARIQTLLRRLIDQARRAAATVVNIDHHPDNRRYGDVNWIDVSAAATGELVYELLVALGAPLTPPIATNLFTALHTDTGSFRYSNVTPRTFRT